MGIILGIAIIYSALCLFYTAKYIIDNSEFSLCLFNPIELIEGSFDLAYIDLSKYIPTTIESYNTIITNYTNLISELVGKEYAILIFVAVGFILVIAGCVSKPSREFAGEETNPQEYLFTSRPRSVLKCIAMPWNIFAVAWKFKKIPVIIPILLIPFIIPFAILMDIVLLIIFLIAKGIMGARIKSAFSKDDAIYKKVTQYAVCPKCKRNFYQPKVICRCGLVIDYPVPDVHGVSTHTCNKGHTIPCTNVDGARGKLKIVCPYCKEEIQTHEAKPLTFSMVGASGSGKTTMMLSAVESISAVAKSKGIITEPVSSSISLNVQRAKDTVAPTVTGELDSQCLFIRSREFPEKEIIFNDISGLEFEPDSEKILFEEYYKYNDGIVFAIDPLEVYALFNSNSPSKASKTSPTNTFEAFYSMFTEINGYGPSVQVTVPMAIVFTKMDNPRVSSIVNAESSPEEFLNKYGQESFVKIVKSTFIKVKYFTVASLGNDISSAAEPFKWVLIENDEDLKTKVF